MKKGYNNLEVVYMAVARDQLKALVDRLTDEQVQALWVILSSMTWPEEEISPEEASEINQARAEIEAGKGIKAGDVWRELGI
ncbi:MAG: hypothetical protein M1130_01810 [Actinobacteria bacterium]|nr:hypothetical protein [Actinomycetota bacterium]